MEEYNKAKEDLERRRKIAWRIGIASVITVIGLGLLALLFVPEGPTETLLDCFYDPECVPTLSIDERATAIFWSIDNLDAEYWATQAAESSIWANKLVEKYEEQTSEVTRLQVMLARANIQLTQVAGELEEAYQNVDMLAALNERVTIELAIAESPQAEQVTTLDLENTLRFDEIYWAKNCDNDSPYDGVWYPVGDGYCQPGVVAFDFWHNTPSPRYSIGLLTYYAEGVMDRVLVNRGMTLPDGYKGAVAMPMCGDVGETVWIRRPGESFDGPFLVGDCSARLHLYYNVTQFGMVAEVDWETSRRYNMQGGMSGVGICKTRSNPGSKCPSGSARSLSNWFYANALFTTYDDTP